MDNLQKFYRFVNIPVEKALKTFEKGLYSAGFFNFGKDLPKVLKEKLGLDLKKDSKKKLLHHHWNNLLAVNGKPVTYFISLTLSPDPFRSLDFDSLIRFKILIPSDRIARRIGEINERILVVEASKENGAYYNESEYTFLNYHLPARFIKGFDLLERMGSSPRYKKVLSQENPNFNPV